VLACKLQMHDRPEVCGMLSVPCGCRLRQLRWRRRCGCGAEVGVRKGLCCCDALVWVKGHQALQQVQGTRGCLQEQHELMGMLLHAAAACGDCCVNKTARAVKALGRCSALASHRHGPHPTASQGHRDLSIDAGRTCRHCTASKLQRMYGEVLFRHEDCRRQNSVA
jgi:hypothetical protein